MADLATVDDIEAIWRDLNPGELVRAATLLTLASAVLRLRVPGIDYRIAQSTLDPTLVALTVAQAVARRLRTFGREDLRQAAESIEGYSDSQTWANSAPTSADLFTDADLALLAPGVHTKLGTIRLVPLWPLYGSGPFSN